MHSWIRSGESTPRVLPSKQTDNRNIAVLSLRRLAHFLLSIRQRHDASSYLTAQLQFYPQTLRAREG